MTQPSRPSESRPTPQRSSGSINSGSELVPSVRIEGTAVLATVRGEIDLHNSPEVRTALLDVLNKHQPKKLILNLSQVPYMDSSAIAVLVESLQKLKKIGGKLYLTHLQPRVKGLLEIARLDSIFVLAATDDEALKK
jgi:anti-anti-sigma factor